MEGPRLAGAPCCCPSPRLPGGPGRRHRRGWSWRAPGEAAEGSRTSRERRQSAPVPPRSAPRTAKARRELAKRTIAAAFWCEVRERSPGPASLTGAFLSCVHHLPAPGRVSAPRPGVGVQRDRASPPPTHPRHGTASSASPAAPPLPRLCSVRRRPGPGPAARSSLRLPGAGPGSPCVPAWVCGRGAGLGQAQRAERRISGSSRGATDTLGRPSPAGGTGRRRERGESIGFAFKPLSQEKSVMERRRVRGYFFFFLFIISLARPGSGGWFARAGGTLSPGPRRPR